MKAIDSEPLYRDGRHYDLLFIPFNSMQHLHDRDSLERFFGCVKMHLKPGGTFALDVFNPSLRLLTRDPSQRYPVFEYPDPDGSGTVRITESIVYDDALLAYNGLRPLAKYGTFDRKPFAEGDPKQIVVCEPCGR